MSRIKFTAAQNMTEKKWKTLFAIMWMVIYGAPIAFWLFDWGERNLGAQIYWPLSTRLASKSRYFYYSYIHTYVCMRF